MCKLFDDYRVSLENWLADPFDESGMPPMPKWIFCPFCGGLLSIHNTASNTVLQADEKAVAWLNEKTGIISAYPGGGYDVPLFRR